MHSPRLVIRGGSALLVGGAIEVALWALMPTLGERSLNSGNPFVFQILILLGTIGTMILAGGLAALHVHLISSGRQRNPPLIGSLAKLGLVASCVTALTMALSLAQVTTVGLISPDSFLISVVYPAGLWALPVSAGLLGVCALLAKSLGLWGILPLILCAMTASGLPDVIAGAGWMLLGYLLLSGMWSEKARTLP